jgi:hypothetical protein
MDQNTIRLLQGIAALRYPQATIQELTILVKQGEHLAHRVLQGHVSQDPPLLIDQRHPECKELPRQASNSSETTSTLVERKLSSLSTDLPSIRSDPVITRMRNPLPARGRSWTTKPMPQQVLFSTISSAATTSHGYCETY